MMTEQKVLVRVIRLGSGKLVYETQPTTLREWAGKVAESADDGPEVFDRPDLDDAGWLELIEAATEYECEKYAARVEIISEAVARLEYLRGEIHAERISYLEVAELAGLAEHIEPGDVELLEWAGVPESEGDA